MGQNSTIQYACRIILCSMKNTKGTILLIEDDIDLQDLLTGYLKPRGYEVLPYNDALKAVGDLNNKVVNPDVIITDLMLPGFSGIEFTTKIKSLGITTPIILITAHKKVEHAVEAIKAGAYDFVVKPLNFPQLLNSIEGVLHLKEEGLAVTIEPTPTVQRSEIKCDDIICVSQGMTQALALARRVSGSTANVLITGESGTGKEVIAKAIHNFGVRSKKPFVAINCSAIPENLLESELFGHAKGSFTGASDKKVGLFEEADGGTLFLDEIGDMSFSLQAKILRVIQDRKIQRVGENQSRLIDVRIISATHKDLRREISDMKFREDLFFRLNVIPILIPPLRERKEDIMPLAEFFLKKFVQLNRLKVKGFSNEVVENLLSQPWRGNVRELENVIERAVVLCNSEQIQLQDIQCLDTNYNSTAPDFNLTSPDREHILTINELSKRYVMHVLNLNDGARDKTARDLGIDRKTLYRKIREIQNH